MRRDTVFVLVVVSLLGGCKAEAPVTPNYTADAKVSATRLEPPTLSSTNAVLTPLPTVAVRGNAKGANLVVIKGGVSDVVRSPLPQGEFCLDVPLKPNATSTLEVSLLGEGQVSPSVTHKVTHDPSAPPPPSPYCELPACQPGPCPEREEGDACSDGKDNDLDGWTDECDLDCSGCPEDEWAPNAIPANVPYIPPGNHDLMLCPCHDDWFRFEVTSGGKVDVRITFSSSAIDIDMKLFRAKDAENAGYKSNEPVKSSTGYNSTSSTSSESIYYTSTGAETYYLYIYPKLPRKSGKYRLTVW